MEVTQIRYKKGENMTYLQVLFLCMIPALFFLGGKASPLWGTKWYRTFIYAIGLADEKKGDSND